MAKEKKYEHLWNQNCPIHSIYENKKQGEFIIGCYLIVCPKSHKDCEVFSDLEKELKKE